MRLKVHIPNTITSLNLLCGAVSIILSFKGEFIYSALFIALASIFDFFDGLAARALHAYSEIGKELDSLADDISFGLAPSLILFNYLSALVDTGQVAPFVPYITLIIAPFSAIRLAKFNLDSRQTTSFLGLPTPACALLCAFLIAFAQNSPQIASPFVANNFSLPVLALTLSLLLVCEIPMFSLKMKSLKWSGNQRLYLFLISASIVAIVEALLGIDIYGTIASIFLLYIVWNIASALFPKRTA